MSSNGINKRNRAAIEAGLQRMAARGEPRQRMKNAARLFRLKQIKKAKNAAAAKTYIGRAKLAVKGALGMIRKNNGPKTGITLAKKTASVINALSNANKRALDHGLRKENSRFAGEGMGYGGTALNPRAIYVRPNARMN